MADKRISELPAATGVAGADILLILQGGANKKVTAANLFNKINTPVHINESQGDRDTRISGVSDANLVFVDASTSRIGIGTNTPIDKLDVEGGLNIQGVQSNESFNVQTVAGTISIITDTTIVNTISNITVTLPSSARQGQTKTVLTNSTGTVTLNGTNLRGFSSIVFDAIGESAVLKYVDGGWYILSTNGATVA